MTISVLNTSPAEAQELSYPPQPPVAKMAEKVDTYHGDSRVDNYYWLRDKANPEVAAYLEAENAYTDGMMKHTEKFQEQLYKEMLGRIKETDENPPYKQGDWWYYSRTEEGKQYPIMARKKSPAAKEELVIDQNELAKGLKFFSIATYVPSDDNNTLAYSTDTTGFRQYTLQFKDLRTGKLLPEKIEKTGSVAWAADNKTVFYTVEDHAKRHYRLYRHVIGTDPKNDAMLYEEKDERFSVGVGRTRSKQYLVMELGSHTTTENWFLSAGQPTGKWQIIQPREQEHEYYVDHRGDEWYIRTNDKGRNFRLVTAPLDKPGKANWREAVPHRDKVMLEDFDLFKDYLVRVEREEGLRQLVVTDFKTNKPHNIKFPEPVYTVFPGPNKEWDTQTLRYTYESLVTPKSVFDYDMARQSAKLVKEYEVRGGYDRNQYASERIWITARDGVKVPVSLLYKKGMEKNGKNPLYLYAYGSYGYPLPINFSSNRVSLVDRGVVFAMAHIRGGGDLGTPWHDDGKMMKKMNTFNDFIDAAQYLVDNKYTSSDRLVIEGGSAGGLLMGSVINMRPDLFKAVISKVPFVEVLNTMLDDDLPLTVGEYEEWGNPNKKEDYFYMKQYSPYDNLAKKEYPTILVKTSFNDSQVMYWEPAKYTAKLRTLKTDNNPLLLKTNMAAGHGGASGRYDYLKEVAFDYSFMLWQMGLLPEGAKTPAASAGGGK